MILVDTSIWVEHLRRGDADLASRLDAGEVLGHPFVLGELALGDLRQRRAVLDALAGLPQALVASDDEVLEFIRREALHGQGIGYIDAHLLASVRLSPDAGLWTRDRKLRGIAARLGVSAR